MRHYDDDIRALTARELLLDELAVPWSAILALRGIGIALAAAVVLGLTYVSLRMEVGDATREIRAVHDRIDAAVTSREQLRLELAMRNGDAMMKRAVVTYGLVTPEVVDTLRLEDVTP